MLESFFLKVLLFIVGKEQDTVRRECFSSFSACITDFKISFTGGAFTLYLVNIPGIYFYLFIIDYIKKQNVKHQNLKYLYEILLCPCD